MPLEFRSRIPLGTLESGQMRAALKAMGCGYIELDRWVIGKQLGYGDEGQWMALKRLIGEHVNSGPSDLRLIAHRGLLLGAKQQVAYLARVLAADLVLAD